MVKLKDFCEKLNNFSAKTQQKYQKTQGTGGFGPLPTLGNRPKKPEIAIDQNGELQSKSGFIFEHHF